MPTNSQTRLADIARRIKEMREIMGWTPQEMAQKTEVSEAEYLEYEAAEADMPFTFIHKCALAFDVDLTDLIEGNNAARLTSYTVTRKGMGQKTAKEQGIDISNLAPRFKGKIAEPYWVKYEYSAAQQN